MNGQERAGGPEAEAPATRGLAMVLVVAGAPAAWLGHLLVSYGLVAPACSAGSSLWLHLTTAAALATIAAVAVAAQRLRRDRGGAQAGFVATMSLAMCGLFALVVAFAGLANLIVGPCR